MKSLNKNVNVKFTTGTVTHILSSIISVKQGDLLGPILFTIFIAAIMITWTKMYDRPLCIFRTKQGFILTGRRSTTRGIDFSRSMLALVISQISPQKQKFCSFQLHHLLTPNLQLLTTEIYSISTLAQGCK